MRQVLATLSLFAASLSQASVIGVVHAGEEKVLLHDEQRVCTGAARAAEYVHKDNAITHGCYVLDVHGGFLFVVFFDAEIGRIPLSAIRKPADA